MSEIDRKQWRYEARIEEGNYEHNRRIWTLLNMIDALEAKCARLEWKPITPENMPMVGDEVAEYIFATVDEPDYWIVSEVDYDGGWSSSASYRRPINPPKETAE